MKICTSKFGGHFNRRLIENCLSCARAKRRECNSNGSPRHCKSADANRVVYPWPELEISDSKPNGTIMNFETNSEMCWIRVPNNPVHMQHAHVVNRSPQIAELNIVTMTHTHAHFQVRFVIQYSRQHCEQISARFWFWPKLMPATSKQRHVCVSECFDAS